MMMPPFTLRATQSLLTLYEDFSDATKTIDPIITATRASSAMYRDSNGIWQTVGTDVIRAHAYQHYDQDTNEPQGLWVESSRTNSALWCRDWTNAVYTATNMTVTKTATGIDGVANSASTLTATAGNATVLQSITSASAARVQSVFIKRRTGSGTVEMTMDNGATWTAITVTGSWRQVRIPQQTIANPVIGIRVVTSGDSVDVDYLMHESGVASDMVSSPILTTTTAATRASDDIQIGTVPFAAIYNQTEGTLFAIARQIEPSASTNAFCSSSGASTNTILLALNVSTGTAFTQIEASSVTQTNRTLLTGYTGSSFVKMAVAYKVNDVQGAANGVADTIDTTATMPAVVRFMIGRPSALASTSRFNGFLRRIAYYRARFPQSVLETMTT